MSSSGDQCEGQTSSPLVLSLSLSFSVSIFLLLLSFVSFFCGKVCGAEGGHVTLLAATFRSPNHS